MGSWKSHVRAKLQQRDLTEKLPYVGVFTSCKLSQTVSDLTTVLYLKEAELQYWQSRVSHYRQEALTLAKGSNTLKVTISELEFTIECQSKELAALRAEQKGLKQTLAQARTEKEELLQRWMEEKREGAVRLNKYNAAQERWQHWAKQLKMHLHRDMANEDIPIVTSSRSGTTETSPSVIQVSPENEARSRQTCTNTGIMLTQAESSLPQALNFERYPKWKTRQGVGRRKCLDDHRQHNSHFCLCHDGADSSSEQTRGNITNYQTEFMVKQAVNGPTSTRRFPRNHQQKSAEAALAQAGEQFMWFGRHDSDFSDTLQVLAATNYSGTFQAIKYSYT
ncbi:hypothetical protein GBF38_002377 [Nibea albiflora]|uniref:Uncharacterized protein n=1 Tax=Nibea albiflora TaxID=240163 RepID=A0ACB7EDF2_NIBAL|nr:hypothetical protein GBF38_002377 [Nibea albiflora]